ncbi:hypothetical protein C7212DRAFT_340425 [Tuber magnatum]|uniref:Uncharacterized protein n=1 Tax=Tuber magnatum TaxID=42249 RepID=A0A317SZ21_9PEZI|nr:hypothetical protein C7212DRAFT_340425 [Tuber magnatum]
MARLRPAEIILRARQNQTTQPNLYSLSKELHQNASSSGRQSVHSQHARSPLWSLPISVGEGIVETASKVGRRKTATPKAAAIAQEPRMNVDGTVRKNPRKHQTDKPEERKAKRKRPEREGMGRFPSNPRGNSNARSKSTRPPARSNPTSRQPAERNPSFSAPLIPTGAHQSRPEFPHVGQTSQSPVTPPKRFVDAISISSSSPISPATLTDHAASTSGGREIVILSPGSSRGAGGPVSDPGSSVGHSTRGSEPGGHSLSSGSDEERCSVWIIDKERFGLCFLGQMYPSVWPNSALETFVWFYPYERSLGVLDCARAIVELLNGFSRVRGRPYCGIMLTVDFEGITLIITSPIVGARGTYHKPGVRGRTPREHMLTDSLERKLREILPVANEFYEKNPELGVHYSRQRFDDFLSKKDDTQVDARFQFLKENLRTYTSDKRALEWEEVLTGNFEPNDYQWALTDHLEVWGLRPPTVAIEEQSKEGSPGCPKGKRPWEDLGVRSEASLETGEVNASGRSPKDEPSPDEAAMRRADLSQRAEALPLPAAGPMPFFPACPPKHCPSENSTRTPTETPRPASPSPQETPRDPVKKISRLEPRDSCIGDQSSSTTSTTPPTSQHLVHSTRVGRKKLTRPLPLEFAGESQSVVEARSRALSSGPRQSRNPVLQRISGLRAREHSIWQELSDVAKKVKEKDIEFEKMIENAKVPIGDEMDPDLDSGLEADSVAPIENERQKVSPDWEALWSIHTDQRCFHEKMKQQEMRLVREGSIINVEIKELQKRTSEHAAMVNRVAHHSPQCTESVLGDDDSTLRTESSSATRSFNDLRDSPAFGGRRSIFGLPMGDSLVEGLKLWSGQSDSLAPVTSSVAAEASEAARAKKRTRRRRMGW